MALLSRVPGTRACVRKSKEGSKSTREQCEHIVQEGRHVDINTTDAPLRVNRERRWSWLWLIRSRVYESLALMGGKFPSCATTSLWVHAHEGGSAVCVLVACVGSTLEQQRDYLFMPPQRSCHQSSVDVIARLTARSAPEPLLKFSNIPPLSGAHKTVGGVLICTLYIAAPRVRECRPNERDKCYSHRRREHGCVS